jgi:hypothetical protein
MKTAASKLFLLAAFLLSAACVRVDENRNPSVKPSRLIVTRDIQGVRLTIQTEKNVGYRIYYREGDRGWTLLPEGSLIRGTGGPVEILDPAPTAARRRYRSETIVSPSPR